MLWPALAIALTSIALALLGNALRDELERSGCARRNARSPPPPVVAASPRIGAVTGSTRRRRESRPSADRAPTTTERRAHRRGAARRHRPRASATTSRRLGDEVVHDVSLTVRRGEVHGLIGESGSGKTQTAFSVLRLLPRGGRVTGRHRSSSRACDLDHGLGERDFAAIRAAASIAYIPQEPMSNLDPSFTIGSQLVEPMRVAPRASARRRPREKALALLARVGIPEPEAHVRRLPARDLGRHGAARADRRRGLVRPRPAHRRRADHGARRDRAGRGARPAARPAGRSSTWRCSSSPTTSASSPTSATASRSCRRGRIVETGPRPLDLPPRRAPVHRSRCSPRSSTRVPRGRRSTSPRQEHSDDRSPARRRGPRRRVPRQGLPRQAVPSPEGRLARHQAGRDRRPGRRVRLGQDHARPGRARPGAGHRRHVRYRGRDIRTCTARSAATLSQRDPGGLPGPLLLAQPVADDRADPHRAADRPRRLERGREAARRRPARPGAAAGGRRGAGCRASSPAGSASASPSPARWRSTRSSSSATSPCRRSTSRPRRGCSTSSSRSRSAPASPTCSSPTTSPWCATSATASR